MDFQQPYESPIEQLLLVKLGGHLARSVVVTTQVPFATRLGNFRVDALMALGDVRVALECDGKEYHDWRRDQFRDSMLLGEGHVTDVCRFTGSQIVSDTFACIRAIALWFPEFFTERGLEFCEVQRPWIDLDSVDAVSVGGRDGRHTFFAFRRTQHERDMWRSYYRFVTSRNLASIDEAVSVWIESGCGAERIVKP